MAIVLKSSCNERTGTCENPEFPNWAWRFNRNQHMTPYYPWQIREEQKPPYYRNMGMHRHFRFHPNGPADGATPMYQLGVNLSHELINQRQSGFGNSALGRTPGPAPPRLVAYSPPNMDREYDDLYTINEVHLISPGMSLHNYVPLLQRMSDEHAQPLNPCHYLEKTLGQVVDMPGTFPMFNKPLPSTSVHPTRMCDMQENTSCGDTTDLMARWRSRQAEQMDRYARDRCCSHETPHFPDGGDSHRPTKTGPASFRQCVPNRR